MNFTGFLKTLITVAALVACVAAFSRPVDAAMQTADQPGAVDASKTANITPKTLMKKDGENMQYSYQAQTVTPFPEPRSLTIRSILWNCEGTLCTRESTRPMPSLAACKALVREVGPITLYGREGMQLSKRLLRKCNRVISGIDDK